MSPQPSMRFDSTFDTTRSMESIAVSSIPVSISEQQKLVKKWWREINPYLFDSCDVTAVIEKLIDVGISSDSNEARKIIARLIGHKRTIEYAEFLQIFVKSMMKGAVNTLAAKVSGLFSDLEANDKIMAYKRALLLSGLKYFKYQISPQEGYQALRALKKLKGDKLNTKLTE